MKKILLSIAAAFMLIPARADEGMWIPMLIGKNYEAMKKLGFRLTADDVYNVNHASLKDAIVHFGGGCTGEIISPTGLLITNHHCGYGNIAGLSSVEHNYLENGFWAKSTSEELPAPGLTVKFLISMEDVTAKINAATKNKKKLEKLVATLKEEAEQGGKYTAMIQSYFGGNQQILLVYEVYTDVRLVGTPPKSLGKYGGDTDNWMWPRHTADFSMFRVYANKDNKPAAYSKDNVPYKPKHYLPVSIKGVEESDYAMIMGYPGRTNRYETSYGVDLAINEENPSVVKIRDMRLATMRKAMRQDPAVNLKLASNYASIANYWKYFIGQTEQLKRLHVVDDKKVQEKSFTDWAKTNKNAEYANLMTKYSAIYNDYRPYAKQNIYYREAILGSAVAKMGNFGNQVAKLMADPKTNKEDLEKALKNLKALRTSTLASMDNNVEKEILGQTAEIYYNDIPKSQHPAIYEGYIFKQFGSDKTTAFTKFAENTFANSIFLNDTKFESFIKNPDAAVLSQDPAVMYAASFADNYDSKFKEKTMKFNEDKAIFAKSYIKGLTQQNPDKEYYPDANSTMRVTYGSVKGYNPQDAVVYKHYTTIDGLMAKYKPNDYEFDLPAKFLDLYKQKDWGQYANKDGELVTCFVTNNDITGGNSGSPVINANGELLGLAFDGNWEAMSGDIAFDKEYKRTITVDIRYVLWLIEKYGNAQNLIDEMTIRK